MQQYIALFRGINVGGKNILPMKELTDILTSLGCTDIQTYIQSGNVVFSSSKKSVKNIAADISSTISKAKGFEPTVLLLTDRHLQDAIATNPYDTSSGKALHFFFLAQPPKKPNIERLESLKTAIEQFTLTKSVLYLYAPDGIGRSRLAAAVEKSLGIPVTARNWNTVAKLAEMVKQ